MNTAANTFSKITIPLPTRYAEKLIRGTLQIPPHQPITIEDIEKAIDHASSILLRQTVGSCFATSIAILIQEERKDLLQQDLKELLYHSCLSRTIDGEVFIAPISLNHSDNCPLLQVWEYTLATFSDFNKRSSHYKLISILGFDTEDSEGIGQVIYSFFQQNLESLIEDYNKKVEQIHQDEQRLHIASTRYQRAYREEELKRLKNEAKHLNMKLDYEEEVAYEKKGSIEKFKANYTEFIRLFQQLLKDEFFEVYDADLASEVVDIYEDRKAGFRLVYKKGLKDPLSYQRIYNKEEFEKALVHFFQEACRQIAFHLPELESLIYPICEALSSHIYKPAMQERFISKTPWAYISGGSLYTLLQGYFGLQSLIEEEICYPHTPLELAIFYLDLLKSLSHDTQKVFLQDAKKRLLATSPTHAFTLMPGLSLFKEGWSDNGFSYTWLRDRLLVPSIKVFESLKGEREHLLATYDPIQADTLLRQMAGDRLPFLPFADTNWPSPDGSPYYFAFQVHPQTGELELWRTTLEGKFATPLRSWDSYFSTESRWSVLTRRFQYGGEYTTPRIWQKI